MQLGETLPFPLSTVLFSPLWLSSGFYERRPFRESRRRFYDIKIMQRRVLRTRVRGRRARESQRIPFLFSVCVSAFPSAIARARIHGDIKWKSWFYVVGVSQLRAARAGRESPERAILLILRRNPFYKYLMPAVPLARILSRERLYKFDILFFTLALASFSLPLFLIPEDNFSPMPYFAFRVFCGYQLYPYDVSRVGRLRSNL